MNRWGIPKKLEEEILQRDKYCVYCGVQMTTKSSSDASRRRLATWEHIINDACIVNAENIARCCSACNSSKGPKDLREWLKTDYCERNGITKDTVAQVVKNVLKGL